VRVIIGRRLSGERIIAAAASAPPGTSRPSRRIRWTLYVIGLSVWASGVLYWTFDHYMLRHTDIGLSENPLQVWWLRLHAGTATAAIWLLGYISAIHVQRNWRPGQRRSTGLLFLTAFALLVVTGYLLYYVDADRPAAMLMSIHWIVGLCVPAAFLLHRGWQRRRGLVPLTAPPPVEVAAQAAVPVQAALPAQPALAVQDRLSAQPAQPSLSVQAPLSAQPPL
jgi:hypothetical protein